MSKLSLSSLDKTHLEGKKVLVRVDFNVPLNEGGQIPTIRVFVQRSQLLNILLIIQQE